MYKAFYGLREKPFNLTPDPRFLYLSEKHKEAFAHLLYGIRSRSGFVMVTGEIGTGKTTICRNLLNQLDEDTELAFIFNPMLSPLELLKKIVSEFGIDAQGSNALELTEELNEYLLEAAAKGKNCVLLIDEAQNLEPNVLEQIRLLSNLETETEKLLQIVLIGQPELGEKLELHELRQLNQRITARYHLKPLSEKEVTQYVAYRLHVAGGRRNVKFARSAVRAVYKISKGTPRVINALCDRALLIGFTKEVHTITAAIVNRAYREIRGDAIFGKNKPKWTLGQLLRSPVAAIALVCILAGVYLNSPTVQTHVRDTVQRVATALPAGNTGEPDGTAPAPTTPGDTVVDPVATPAPVEPAATAPSVTATPPTALANSTPVPASESLAETPPVTQPEIATQPLEVLLASASKEAVETAALAALLDVWNKDINGKLPDNLTDATLDAFLRNQRWSYDRLKPALDQLLALDLPALVKVIVSGEPRWVALSGATPTTLTVATPGSAVTVDRKDFQSIYAAEAIVPWNDPTPGAPTLREGHENIHVAELKDKLKQLNRLRAENNSPTYDVETASAVSRIQAETSLEVDGIAGQQVRMVLSSWLKDEGTPSLTGTHGSATPRSAPAREPSLEAKIKATTAPDTIKPAPAVTPAAVVPPAEKTPAVPKPLEETPAPETATTESPAAETPATESVIAETPKPDAPAEGSVVAETPMPDVPEEDTPVETPGPGDTTVIAETPAHDAPAAVETPATTAPDTTEAALPDTKSLAEAVSAPATSTAPITLTNIKRDGEASDTDAANAAPADDDSVTSIPVAPAANAQLVVVELDDPGSSPPAEVPTEVPAKAPADTPPASEG